MNAIPPMPALKSLGQLADSVPTVLIDSREQQPLQFSRLPSRVGTLTSGDYSVQGLEDQFSIERKSVPDLVACIGPERERFERELCRLRGYRFRRLLIVGARSEIEQHKYRSNVAPAAVMGSLQAWECRYDLPFIFEPDPVRAAALVEGWAWYFAREVVGEANALLRGCQQDAQKENHHETAA